MPVDELEPSEDPDPDPESSNDAAVSSVVLGDPTGSLGSRPRKMPPRLLGVEGVRAMLRLAVAAGVAGAVSGARVFLTARTPTSTASVSTLL